MPFIFSKVININNRAKFQILMRVVAASAYGRVIWVVFMVLINKLRVLKGEHRLMNGQESVKLFTIPDT